MSPDDLADVLARLLKSELDPLRKENEDLRHRLVLVEQRAVAAGRDGRDGFQGPIGEKGLTGDRGEFGPTGPAGPQGPQGLTGEAGKDGAHGSPGERGEVGAVGAQGEKGDTGEAGPQGEVGSPGERGEEGPIGPAGDRGQPGEIGPGGQVGPPGSQGDRGEKGLGGKDGASLVDGIIDREGRLVLTLDTGETKTVGKVVGSDGLHGKDGTNGQHGKDGINFDLFDVLESGSFDVERRLLTLALVKGDQRREVAVPMTGLLIYRGIYENGKAYEIGDVVTLGGSNWSCLFPTMSKPGPGTDTAGAWKLSVKCGRDGRDAPGAKK